MAYRCNRACDWATRWQTIQGMILEHCTSFIGWSPAEHPKYAGWWCYLTVTIFLVQCHHFGLEERWPSAVSGSALTSWDLIPRPGRTLTHSPACRRPWNEWSMPGSFPPWTWNPASDGLRCPRNLDSISHSWSVAWGYSSFCRCHTSFQICLGKLSLIYTLIYLDDVIIYSQMEEEHLHHLQTVFKQFQ